MSDKAERALRAVTELRKLLTKKVLTGRDKPPFRLELEPPSSLLREHWQVIRILKQNGFGPWDPSAKAAQKPPKKKTKKPPVGSDEEE